MPLHPVVDRGAIKAQTEREKLRQQLTALGSPRKLLVWNDFTWNATNVLELTLRCLLHVSEIIF